MRVYMDNAATTRMSKLALESMTACMSQAWGNPSSLHQTGQKAAEILLESRKIVATCLNAASEEIYFVSGGSEADNQAILSAAAIGERQGKKHIISTAFEHHAVLHTLERLQKRGFEITLLPVYEEGIIRLEDLRQAVRGDTCLVTVMYVNNEIGTIQPVREIGAFCRKRKILFHTDAVQAAGHLSLDVQELCVDMLSISAHKFHGPKGVGALYVRKGIPLTNLIDGGAQERGKRGGTENVAGIFSMAAALQDADGHRQEHEDKVLHLRNRLAEGLNKIPHSKINGSMESRVAGNLNMVFEGIEGESMLLMLTDRGIEASSGSACTSGSLDPSHVLLSLGLPHEVAHGSLRLSLSFLNTEEEVDYVLSVLPDIVSYLRDMSPVWHELQKGELQYVIQ